MSSKLEGYCKKFCYTNDKIQECFDKFVMPMLAFKIVGCSFLIGYELYDKQKRLQEEYDKYSGKITGTVIEEKYNNANLRYTLKLQTIEGIIAVSVVDTYRVKKEGLDALIEEGSVVSFERSPFYQDGEGLGKYKEETNFTPDIKIGTKRADRIEVL